MKHLKTYENMFTNIFKSDYKPWEDMMANQMGDSISPNYNALIDAARDGNWKRFKRSLKYYKKELNDIYTDTDDTGRKHYMNVLITVVSNSNIGLWEKRKMIKALIDNGIDVYFFNDEGKCFYDFIIDDKIREWIDIKYPEIVKKLKIEKATKKYNL